MGYRVPNHMRQSDPKRCEHVCVQASGTAERFEQNLFPQRRGSAASSSLEQREEGGYGKEPQSVGCITHLGKLGFDLIDSRREVALEAFKVIAKVLSRCANLRSRGVRSPLGFEFELLGYISDQVAGQASRSLDGFHF